MKTEGIFKIHTYTIPFSEYGKPIYLLPFGDVHRDSPLCWVEGWKEWLAWAKTKDRAYFLGMGDYNDMISGSERAIMGLPGLHESTQETLEDVYLSHTKLFADECSFMKGKIIGIMNGNHYAVLKNGITTDQKLAEYLDAHYLGVSTLIRLVFQDTVRGEGKSASIDIFAHHGRGGGRTIGASMNPVSDMAKTAEADLYLMGDNHQKGADYGNRLRLTAGGGSLRLRHRKLLYARTGSFLRGYVDGKKSYVTDAQYPPSCLGTIKVELTPKRDRSNGEDFMYIDIHVSV